MRQARWKDPLHARCATGPAACPRARNRSASHAGVPDARGSSGLASDGALAIRQRIRAPLRLAVPPSRTSQQAHADRSDATASRRVAVKSSAWGRPDFADHGRERRAPYPFLHRPQRVARVARLDVDEILRGKSRRMDSPAFEDRHALLHPQQGFVGAELRQQEPCPAAIARVRGEQFATGWGWAARAAASVRPARWGSWGSFFGRTASAAGDQGKPAATQLTTFLFYFCSFSRRVRGRESMPRDSAASLSDRADGPPSPSGNADFANDSAERGAPQHGAHMIGVDLHRSVDLMVQPARRARRDDPVPAATRRPESAPAACRRRAETAAR